MTEYQTNKVVESLIGFLVRATGDEATEDELAALPGVAKALACFRLAALLEK